MEIQPTNDAEKLVVEKTGSNQVIITAIFDRDNGDTQTILMDHEELRSTLSSIEDGVTKEWKNTLYLHCEGNEVWLYFTPTLTSNDLVVVWKYDLVKALA